MAYYSFHAVFFWTAITLLKLLLCIHWLIIFGGFQKTSFLLIFRKTLYFLVSSCRTLSFLKEGATIGARPLAFTALVRKDVMPPISSLEAHNLQYFSYKKCFFFSPTLLVVTGLCYVPWLGAQICSLVEFALRCWKWLLWLNNRVLFWYSILSLYVSSA